MGHFYEYLESGIARNIETYPYRYGHNPSNRTDHIPQNFWIKLEALEGIEAEEEEYIPQ